MFQERRNRSSINVWPGYVDVLATLLLLFVFVLSLFMVAQYYLTDTLAGREAALARLEDRIAELGEELAMERRAREEVEADLEVSIAEREALREELSSVQSRASSLEQQLQEAEAQTQEDEELIEQQTATIASLQQDVAALRELRDELEAEVGELAAAREEAEEEVGAARDRSKALEAELAEAEERTRLVQRELQEREIRVQDLQRLVEEQQRALAQEEQLTESQQSRIDRLNRQVQALREQLERVSAALELSEETVAQQEAQIEDLGRRLNLALIERVQELSRYRSDFFGRLREVLGDREDIRIEGDRFLFQSELFFDTASAEIGEQGREQLDNVAETILELRDNIPEGIPWVLQVEGHTDQRPINTEEFPSNWELSTARAQAIVDYLIEQGVPPDRLAAAGFGQYHPVAEGNSPEALRRNRRIELRLTQR
ncbi:peptidoglycan -binding protein [Aquisalimonas lutea]|uniref:peptidoglycan -binding protein n=1 Tax=Aquisalimonas lutea TaxID=1327750 RepID=UPI0025B2C5E8|nr:peptidoglycan -binding protein [Aquisalimonas lutea]MDN3516848.1 peptidoglycan -binding protein [Aquisalimonas lutea]